jgi:hypothetical protein
VSDACGHQPEQAELNLSYTTVKAAQADARIGRNSEKRWSFKKLKIRP